jgi:hypothetical protein
MGYRSEAVLVVGDLVKYIGRHAMSLNWQAGLVTGFDEDDDPIVLFFGREPPDTPMGSPFFMQDIEVISESR